MAKLFLSHRLDLLADRLAKELFEDGRGIFAPRIVVVPNHSLKQWILIQAANWSHEKGIAGCKIMTLQEAVRTFLAPSGFTEIFCSLFHALTDCKSGKIPGFLEASPRRTIELASFLTEAFLRYGTFCPALFEPDPATENWQKQLIQKLFVEGPLRPACKMPSLSLSHLHCFGFDYLPPAILRSLNFSSIYLFSPCSRFWEDLCTDRDRKRIGRYWKQKGASDKKCEELDEYLKNAPPLLANWGRTGREMLKTLDAFVEEIEEDYRPRAGAGESNLGRLQSRLLNFTVEEKNSYPEDSSVQISKTGPSRLREIEHVRASILQLMEKEDLLLSDIAVFAPDIQPYAPLIQFVFSDLPYRISEVEIGSKSFVFQGMHRLFEQTFDPDDLMALFENPSFCRAREWDLETLEQIREWLVHNQGDIEARLLDQFIYLFPEEKRRISSGSESALEQFIEVYQSLQSDLVSLKLSRTLSDWANFLMPLMQKYFSVDLSDAADAAAWNFFRQSMIELAETDVGLLYPFGVIQALLKRPISGGQIHSAHLHAVRFASLTVGAPLPVRAVFLIGMDEESFPRRSFSSSLDLLKSENVYLFESGDRDRYLFLQALFAANDFLYLSYSHLSPEGHPINPSPLIDELIRSLDAPIKENIVSCLGMSASSPSFSWPQKPSRLLPEGKWTISLSDLSSLARHPWEFYLKKQFGIRFEKPEEGSFSRQKATILRANLQKPMKDLLTDLPLGICGEALKIDLGETSKEWADRIRAWDAAVAPASFRLSCREKRQSDIGWEFPSLEVNLSPGLQVKIVGEVKTFSEKGFIHAGNDTLDGLLRAWPECLAVLVASGQREIYCLKSGKVKIVDQPIAALKAYITYYFLSLSAPSPLLSDWADALLRKGSAALEEKVRNKMLGKGGGFEDPIWDWAIGRVALPPAAAWFEEWAPLLCEHFSELIAVYPARGSNRT